MRFQTLERPESQKDKATQESSERHHTTLTQAQEGALSVQPVSTGSFLKLSSRYGERSKKKGERSFHSGFLRLALFFRDGEGRGRLF